MSGLKKEYDVIVIGGGVNGLAAAAYLQKAGLEVALFERRDEVGTHCDTQEVGVPGVRYNLHACGLFPHASPAYTDLELEKFGLEMLSTEEWNFFHAFKDGSAVLLHHYDANKQYEAWKRINAHDTELFRKLTQYFAPHWVEFMDRWYYAIPSVETLGWGMELITKCPEVPSDWWDMNGFELASLMWEDERIRTMILSMGISLEHFPEDRAIGAIAAIMGGLPVFWPWHYTARGGSHGLPHALVRCFLHYGGKAFQGCPVSKIIVENGEAKGVALSKYAVYPDAEVRARRAVISDLTPGPTFLDLVGEDKLPAEAVMAVKSYDYNNTVVTVHYVLSEMPQWIQAAKFPEVSEAFGFNIGADSLRDLERLGNDRSSGRLPDPPIILGYNVQGFAVADPTQAPPGLYPMHVWANVPANPRKEGGFENWDNIREGYADKVEKLLCEQITNLKRAIVSRYVTTPLDTYRRNPSAIGGCWGGGCMGPTQFYLSRPFPGCGAPRTPVPKLYISQSLGPMPGTTMLQTGTTAARVVAEDLGIKKPDWWRSKAFEPALNLLKRKYGGYKLAVD